MITKAECSLLQPKIATTDVGIHSPRRTVSTRGRLSNVSYIAFLISIYPPHFCSLVSQLLHSSDHALDQQKAKEILVSNRAENLDALPCTVSHLVLLVLGQLPRLTCPETSQVH